MAEFEVPNSLENYFSDKKIASAVDDLVEKLDGDNMIECDWSEARDYNQALLFAAQVRADLIELLFRIWENTFGTCGPEKLGEACFLSEAATPAYLWEERTVELSYYRDSSPDDGGRSEALLVILSDAHICLWVFRFENEEEFAGLGGAQGVEGWQLETEERGSYLSNIPVKIVDMIADPDAIIKRFRDDAKRMIEALSAN